LKNKNKIDEEKLVVGSVPVSSDYSKVIVYEF